MFFPFGARAHSECRRDGVLRGKIKAFFGGRIIDNDKKIVYAIGELFGAARFWKTRLCAPIDR